MFKLTLGDLLSRYDVDAIVNTVNCVGVMGKGIALQFKHRWPANFTEYAAACKAGEVRPGRMFIHALGGLVQPHYIVNFPTKNHWCDASKISSSRRGWVTWSRRCGACASARLRSLRWAAGMEVSAGLMCAR